eukprot:TRINITY_DN26277_c0_g1_i1.p2 TRINITY_DN26277_c0_g1~~TRINITY_DN26277_c0_g1_i1.p2  ORF type:complete len:162 (+),score=4.34 TRINITY_DN26277_c0_g1_i1:18-503(+)
MMGVGLLVVLVLCVGVLGQGLPPNTPDAIRVAAAGKMPFLAVLAVGTQDYNCTNGQWVFTGPHALLRDELGKIRGVHSPGPRWATEDGSYVVGALSVRAASPLSTMDVPWLWLNVTEKAPGILYQATNILREQTFSGVAPTTPCIEGILKVPYTCYYSFWY